MASSDVSSYEIDKMMQPYQANVDNLTKEVENLKNRLHEMEKLGLPDSVPVHSSPNMSDDELQKRQFELQVIHFF